VALMRQPPLPFCHAAADYASAATNALNLIGLGKKQNKSLGKTF
jgi:hypothetical protein